MPVKRGVIIREKNGLYTVSTECGNIPCRAGSRIRKGGVRPLAGDRVEFEVAVEAKAAVGVGGGEGFIVSVLPRFNRMARPAVANIGAFVIVASAAEPTPYPYVIDKLTVMARAAGVEAALAINKCDLAKADFLRGVYEKAGIRCFALSALSGEGLDGLKGYLSGKTAVLAGASGVGKSSLLNAMYSEVGAETGELSRKILRGKNTTRHTEFFAVGGGTYIADTPGFTLLDEEQLGVGGKERLFDCFPEFAPFFGKCRFRGCTHLKEEGCAVIEAVRRGEVAASRHESYVRLYGALAALRKYD